MLKRLSYSLLLLSVLAYGVSAYAINAIYSDALIGWAKTSGMPSASQVGASKAKIETFPAWRFDIGYNHDLSQDAGIGLETGYGLYGNTKYTFNGGTGTYKQQAWHFLAESTFHLKGWNLMLKGGLVHRVIKASGTNAHSKQKIGGEMQMGIGYPLNKHLDIYAMYDHMFGDDQTSIPLGGVPRINMAMMGIKVTF